jgi:AhpD family alkylhydroperoxidase
VRPVHAAEQSNPMAMVAKKHYSVRQTYWLTYDAARAVRHFDRLRTRDRRFTERIMLAVTEVNGCALCAYGHTRFALDAGLSGGEIRGLLGGVADGVPDAELPAIVFAQHYADTGGHPDQRVWRNLVDAYGEDRALGILGTARMIMCGNAVAIPWSSLLSRLRGAPHPSSSIGYELGTIVGATLVMPVAVIHAGISRLRGKPIVGIEQGPRLAA